MSLRNCTGENSLTEWMDAVYQNIPADRFRLQQLPMDYFLHDNFFFNIFHRINIFKCNFIIFSVEHEILNFPRYPNPDIEPSS